MIVAAVAGYQDSGKTTLIERLIPALNEHGSVATIKSIHHDVEVDTPGKDTYRHRDAGAEAVVGITPSLSFSISTVDTAGERDPDRSLDRGLQMLDVEYDVVLVEGFKRAEVPTILVGSIEESAVDGRILDRVSDPSTVDLQPLVQAVFDLTDG